jgi:hypothetical protein
LRSDREAITKRLRSVYESITKRLRSDYETITKRSQSDHKVTIKAITKRLQSDYKAITKQSQSNHLPTAPTTAPAVVPVDRVPLLPIPLPLPLVELKQQDKRRDEYENKEGVACSNCSLNRAGNREKRSITLCSCCRHWCCCCCLRCCCCMGGGDRRGRKSRCFRCGVLWCSVEVVMAEQFESDRKVIVLIVTRLRCC